MNPACFPAKAGTQTSGPRRWAPAFAGERERL
jgi:hypothetical protein